MVDSFRSGAYDGKTFSGSFGDLGVTITAFLVALLRQGPMM